MTQQPSPDPRLKDRVEAVVAALGKKRDEAVHLARAALADGLVHPLFLNLRAFWLESRGRLDDALADLEKAHEIAPDDVPILNALGLLLAKLMRPAEALKAFEAAVAHDPEFTPAWFNLGWSAEMAGDLDRARLSYEHVVERRSGQPDSAVPLARLALLASRAGNGNAAHAYAARAQALSPGQPLALFAEARADIETGDFDGAEKRLRQILASPTLSDYDRYHAIGVLADLHHRQRRYAEAFALYETSNREMHRIASERRGYAKSRPALALFRRLQHYCENRSTICREETTPPSSPGAFHHVFLMGFVRSGTTLLEQVLASHPDVVTMEEREVFGEAQQMLLATDESLEHLDMLSDEERAAHAGTYWQNAKEQGFEPTRKVFVDKQPLNATKLPLIHAIFPDAKILFAVRDPRDVLLSAFRQRFRVTSVTYELMTLEGAARYYDAYMTVAMRLREVLPLDLHQIRHEDLVGDFEGEVGKVCDFLGLDWTGAMRAFAEHSKTRAIASLSAAQISKGLNREGIGQWRNYREQMAPVLPILRPWVERFGYNPE